MKSLLFALLLFPLFALADQDADFLAAREAFRVGNAARLDHFAARLKDSPLEPYLAYYRLRLHLETEDPSVIRAFLARADNTPVIDRLRGEWLKSLGRKRQWDTFAAEYPHLLNEDTELKCYALQSRLPAQADEVLHEARKLWLSGDEQFPESCAPLFKEALARGVIGSDDVWLRMRMALESGNVTLAKNLSRKLPAKRALPAAELDAAATNPEHYLAHANFRNAGEGRRMVALFALLRLAKRSPEMAFARWDRIAPDFSADERHYFFAWLGYEAARSLDAHALEWYKAAGDAPLTDMQHAWRARAALRAMNWGEVLASITAMPPQQQQETAWRYWRGRALKELGHTEEARKLFVEVSSEYNFYGQLAANELDIPVVSSSADTSYQPDKEDLDAMLARPSIQRTLALYRMDLRVEAYREWVWAIRKFDDRQLLAAAEVARRNRMYDRAINAAEHTVQLHDFSLSYLAPYRDVLIGHIRQNQLEEAWVYGLMRQESRFVIEAKSSAGAHGLMQVMPATARWIARRLGMKHYRNQLIRQMDTNLTLGTYYMKTVLSWFDDNPVLASTAYNAGPRHAREWRGDTPLEGAIYIETIPFPETRDYVKKVMSNTVFYAQQFGQPPRSLKQRLGVIAAKNANNQKPIPDEH